MTIDHQIDHTMRMVVVTITGELTDKSLLSVADALKKAPGVEKDFSLLLDLRGADGQNITTAGVQNLAARPLVLSPESRRAVVVPSVLGFGMARMYELMRGTGGMRVFRDYDEARRWIETGAE